MKFTPAGLFAALLGLLSCALPGASHGAQNAQAFKVLRLEGHQVRWRLPADGAPRVVTYRLATGAKRFPGARNCRGLTKLDGLVSKSHLPPAAIRKEVAAAFAMWEAAANIRFKEAAHGARADILIGAQVEPEGWAFADVFFDAASPETIKPISKALICLNPARVWKVGFDGNLKSYDLRYTLVHEIGHAIGLDHPAGRNQIMGYRYEERFRTLQPGDIHGAVLLYGAPAPPSVLVAAEPQADKAARAASAPPVGRALGK